MAYLEWQEKLNTGIDVIDGQHKRIVNYINQLHEACYKESDNCSKVYNTIIELVDYTISHFVFEESLLKEAGYHKMHEHNKTHKEFSNKIFDYKVRASKGEDVAEQLLNLLHDWLFGHILKEDALYVPTVSRYFIKNQSTKK
ncbi:MAG: bacteriohemerythrin [Alcanivoracaceae bacterium]|nr:bacteriohemerythrin [Alcanivoracaceae bacterium]